MMKSTLVMFAISFGLAAATLPAADDCSCDFEQAQGPGCGGNALTEKCGYHSPFGSCRDPMSCPFCKSYWGEDGSDVSCGVTCKAKSAQASDLSCTQNCNLDPPNCPTELCSCDNRLLVTATNCGQSKIKLANTTAHGVLGQMVSLRLVGSADEEIPGGATFNLSTIHIQEYSTVSVQGSVCGNSTFDMTDTKNFYNESVHIADIAYHGFTCPASKGKLNIDIDFTFPLRRMRDTNYPLTLRAKDKSGGELFCADINVVRSSEAVEILNSVIVI